jgi:hypothetical protein
MTSRPERFVQKSISGYGVACNAPVPGEDASSKSVSALRARHGFRVAGERILDLVPGGLRRDPDVTRDANVELSFEPAEPDPNVARIVVRSRIERRATPGAESLEHSRLVLVLADFVPWSFERPL